MVDVLFCGAWRDGPGHQRTAALAQGLRHGGHAVRECRVAPKGRAAQRRLLDQLGRVLRARPPQCVVVPAPGHELVAPIAAQARAVGVPVVLDLPRARYEDGLGSGRARPGSLAAWWWQASDRRACAAADLVLADRAADAAYLAELTGLPPARFHWLPAHAPAAAAAAPLSPPGPRLRLLVAGAAAAGASLPAWIDAVAMAPDVELTLVGGSAADRTVAAGALGRRVRCLSADQPPSELLRQLAAADVVADAFVAGPRAPLGVVAEALAAGRPVLGASDAAADSWFGGSGAVVAVPADDVTALAEGLRALARDRAAVRAAAAAARPAYERVFGVAAVARRWDAVFSRLGLAAGAVQPRSNSAQALACVIPAAAASVTPRTAASVASVSTT